LVTYKESRPERYVSTGAVLDALLCFGWIDGIRRKVDDERTMQLISPRKAQHWTATYKTWAARLIEEGRMHAAGARSIDRGKESGLWTFMDDVDALIVPDDLSDALDASAMAREHYEAFAPSYRRNLLRWIKLAKTPKTRAKRIARVAQAAQDNERMKNF